jgi:hypothetical protein
MLLIRMKQFIALMLLLLPFLANAQHNDTPKYLLQPFGDTIHTAATPQKSPLEIKWEEQTLSGQNATTEKVTVGFFTTGKNAGVYAFHTIAPRGTILRVRNLNNDRIVYVKVLGPLPLTAAFKGCALGLSSDAKALLGVRDTKAFCEISYLSY